MDGLNTNQTNYRDPLESLETSLQGLSKRSKAIAANIANANTQNYIRREVSFEDALQDELYKEPFKLKTSITDSEHFEQPVTDLKQTINTYLDNESPFNEINNINLEREMIDLTKTGLRYKAVSNITKRYFEHMKGIIRG